MPGWAASSWTPCMVGFVRQGEAQVCTDGTCSQRSCGYMHGRPAGALLCHREGGVWDTGERGLTAVLTCLEAPDLEEQDRPFLARLRTDAWRAMEAAASRPKAAPQLLTLMAQLLPSSDCPRCGPAWRHASSLSCFQWYQSSGLKATCKQHRHACLHCDLHSSLCALVIASRHVLSSSACCLLSAGGQAGSQQPLWRQAPSRPFCWAPATPSWAVSSQKTACWMRQTWAAWQQQRLLLGAFWVTQVSG